jgi:hypothetical protein
MSGIDSLLTIVYYTCRRIDNVGSILLSPVAHASAEAIPKDSAAEVSWIAIAGMRGQRGSMTAQSESHEREVAYWRSCPTQLLFLLVPTLDE